MTAARPEDVATVEAIVAALYDAIGFSPGGRPDWARLRALFLPDARLVPPQVGDPPVLHVVDFDTWMAESNAMLERSELRAKGFREAELGARTERFGDIAHVFSSYGSYYAGDAAPFARGINSIQLVRRDGRWWVLTILWDAERPDRPIPPEYLAAGGA